MNQKLLYIDLHKSVSFSLATKTENSNNCNIKFRYNLYHILTWISIQHWHVQIDSFFSFQSYMNKFQ